MSLITPSYKSGERDEEDKGREKEGQPGVEGMVSNESEALKDDKDAG